jgi:hypothetical protein
MRHNLIINSQGKAGKRPRLTGMAALAASMIMPLRRRLDYQGLARKVLHVEPLPQGAPPYYEKDIDIASMVVEDFHHKFYRIDKNGKAGRRRNRVTLPSFEVYSSPTIKISDVKQRRFNLIDRDVRKARQQLMSREDAAAFKALDDAGKDDKNQ